VPLDGNQWAISVVVALLCVPWGVCVRLLPDAWFETIAKFVGKPFVAMYRPLARLTDRFSRKQKTSEEGSNHKGVKLGGASRLLRRFELRVM
jgi:Ca2+-transporting ATPase